MPSSQQTRGKPEVTEEKLEKPEGRTVGIILLISHEKLINVYRLGKGFRINGTL
jgi:hypothetical protein